MRVKKSNKKLSFAKKRNKITSSGVLNSRFNRRLAFKKFLLSFHPKNLKSKYKYVAIGLTIFIVVPLVYFLNVSAVFDSFGQTTWDGTESDPLNTRYLAKDNIITSINGILKTDTALNENWCDNTPICDDSFTNRQLITVNNADDAIESATNIRLTVAYIDGMQTDFDDLRFTDTTGNNLGYYISGKTDSSSADLFINLPSLPSGNSTIYMYYGNQSASSVSSIDDINKQFEDGFENGNFDSWIKSFINNPDISFNDDNNSILWHLNSNNISFYAKNTEDGTIEFDRTKNRVFEYSAKIDMKSGYSCIYNDNRNFNGNLVIGGIAFANTHNWNDSSQYRGLCDNNGNPIFVPYNIPTTQNAYDNRQDSYLPQIISGTSYQFRQISYETSGSSFWYRVAGTPDWTPMYDSDVNVHNSQDIVYQIFHGMINSGDSYTTPTDLTLNDIYSYSYTSTTNSFGYAQYNQGSTGSLVSNVFDVAISPYFGKVTLDYTGLGKINIKIRTDTDPNMATATDWNECNYLSNDDSIYDSSCVSLGQRYLQYEIFMASTSSVEPTDALILNSVAFEYINDETAPTFEDQSIIAKADTIKKITNDSWSNAISPNFTWSEASDSETGSGLLGYCLYFGTDSDPDLQTTSGLLSGFQTEVQTNKCNYVTTDTTIDFSTLVNGSLIWRQSSSSSLISGYNFGTYPNDINVSGANSGDTLYFIVKPIDKVGNVSETGSQFSYKLDKDEPEGMSIFQPETSNVKNTPQATITWLYTPDEGLGWYDEDSGLAGIKYCLLDLLGGDNWDLCNPNKYPENFMGPNRAEYGTDSYMTDVWQPGDMKLTTDPNDPRYAASVLGDGNGVFSVFVGVMDNAGNISDGDGSYVITKFTTFPSGKPQNLTVDPAEPNSVNLFSFDWDAPEITDNPYYRPESGFIFQFLEGSRDNFSYCWSVNEPINAEGTNCTRTAKGVTELPVGPYATEQGVNTLYVMTINEAGNFLNSLNNVAEIEFTADTIAPGIPQNVEVIDVSTLLDPVDTSIWRLALSWTEPSSGATTVNSYRILRSTDGVNFTEIMSVPADSLSYIDLELSPIEYSYKIMACDNAGSCGIASNVVSMTPTGRYTTPALLSDGPYVDPISTRSATISWETNRTSDSKVFLSTTTGINIESGKYDGGDVTKTTDHSVQLNNLQAGTKYYYIATWTDGNGNVGKTEESSFTTLPAPNIAEVNIKNISIDGSTVDFSVENASRLNMYYGKTENFGGVVSINTSTLKSNYSISLSSLDDDSKYFVKLNGFDNDGNEYQGNTYSFTTVARPKISNLRFQPIADASSNTTMVTWTTNVPTSSELSYGIVGDAQLEVIDSKLKTEHEITISNLTDDKEYNLTARSRDALGNLAVSDVQTFRTALDTRPPKISNITVETTIKGSGSEAKGQVIVSWDTDEPATSQVAYGQGSPGSYSNKTSEDSELVSSHTVVISDLSTSSIYQIQPISKDKADNEADGTNQSAIIGRGSEDVLTIIFNALRNIFGIKA